MAALMEAQLPLRAVNNKIRLDGVSRHFPSGHGGQLAALENINLEVLPGEFLCIVGPSGCGKSTLLHLIAGLDRPSTGEIWIDGRKVLEPGPERILLFQELGLFPWLTARENVEFGLRQKGVNTKERREQAGYYLDLVHLSQFEEHHPHELSGGMKQRVALARALAMQPDVLLDELERVWRETGQTIIFVTHNVREAVRLGDRVLVLSYRPGRIKTKFSISLARPRHIEDPEVASMSKKVLGHLREEIDKSVRAEFHHEQFA